MYGDENQAERIGVAVDLGSTTIAVACLDLKTGEALSSFSYANPQTAYGADVITRIKKCAGNEEMLHRLGGLVRESLAKQLEAPLGGQTGRIGRVVYSGNTVMLHILRGMSVDGLAASPFFPVSLDFAREFVSAFPDGGSAQELPAGKVEILYPPGFSAFVGADILTGAQALSMGRMDSYDLLVDLGTNGEMLLLNRQRGYAASAACGPVFDSAVTGAVYGSECIRMIAGCIRRGLIDRTGLIAEPYFESGIRIDRDFKIKQEHVRNFQLAKGAIFAGVSCLMELAGITAQDVSNIYVSGGLGFYMNVRDAFTVKMLPQEWKGRITVSGNTSLEGAKRLLLAGDRERETLREYEEIRKRTKTIELAGYERFEEKFLQAMNF